LDLVDNSLDGARNQLGNPIPSLSRKADFSKFVVDIRFSETQFSILDNCGGISLDDAVNYAFTFGRRDSDSPEEYSIGIYGIGMKRAVFKMGDSVVVRSTPSRPKAKAQDEPFVVKINVPTWLKSEDWDFDLEGSDPLPESGVEIVVSSLRENISSEFESPAFENGLRRMLARDYSRFIDHGLAIKVNGRRIQAYDFAILKSNKIIPYHAEFMLRGVRVEIIAGMAAAPADSEDPDADSENEDRSGWYVLCNDRMVVAADKTELTGWGYGGKRRWHPQYRGFIGIILFSAPLADQLPLTTTKRSIEKDHVIYRAALARMIELTGEWIEYTNKRKVSLDEAKSFERSAGSVRAFEVPITKSIRFPALSSAAPKIAEVTIQYSKLQRLVRGLAVRLGNPNMSAREVGSRSFDYAYKEIVGDDT
jgi:hypothetical protein